jgi:hypothetical protein
VAAAGDSRWRAPVDGGGGRRRGGRQEGAGRGGRQQQRRRTTRDGVSRETRATGGGASGGVPPPMYVSEPFFPPFLSDPSPLTHRTGYPVSPPTTELVLDDRRHGQHPRRVVLRCAGDRRGPNGGVRAGHTRGFAAAAGACGAVGAAIPRRRVVWCRSHGPRDQTTRRGGRAAAESGARCPVRRRWAAGPRGWCACPTAGTARWDTRPAGL